MPSPLTENSSITKFENVAIRYEICERVHLESVFEALLMSKIVSLIKIIDGKAYFPFKKCHKTKHPSHLNSFQMETFLRIIESASVLFSNVTIFSFNVDFKRNPYVCNHSIAHHDGPFTPFAFLRFLILTPGSFANPDVWIKVSSALELTLEKRTMISSSNQQLKYYALPEEEDSHSEEEEYSHFKEEEESYYVEKGYTCCQPKEQAEEQLKRYPLLENKVQKEIREFKIKSDQEKETKSIRQIVKKVNCSSKILSSPNFIHEQILVDYCVAGEQMTSPLKQVRTFATLLSKIILSEDSTLVLPKAFQTEDKLTFLAETEIEILKRAKAKCTTVFRNVVISRAGFHQCHLENKLWHCKNPMTPNFLLKLVSVWEPKMSNPVWISNLNRVIKTANRITCFSSEGTEEEYLMSPDEQGVPIDGNLNSKTKEEKEEKNVLEV